MSYSHELFLTINENPNINKKGFNTEDHGVLVQPLLSISTITTLQFDEKTRKLRKLSSSNDSSVGESPSWMKISSDGKILYSSNEVNNVHGMNHTGSLSSFTSSDPVAFDISPDKKNMIVASYTGATAARYELNEDQSFVSTNSSQSYSYNATGPNNARQSQCGPTGRIATFTDLGGDRVYIHSVDDKTGELKPIHTIQLKPGTGPRHLTFFVVNESRTDVYLNLTLPSTIQNQTTFGAGEVKITKDGKFVYGTNRQTDFTKPKEDNSIVVFKRDELTGFLSKPPEIFKLTQIGFTPRHFSFSKDPQEKFLVVVGQQDDSAGIYERDDLNGKIEFLDMIKIEKAGFVDFL
ncbi:Lactonase, 7-bladed beta-propeller-domain-containing protein [Melampsora americana]|nr:Lactonase, 7-bladed beta-propeller-domain-containing protein [Melampsora americana]